MSSTGDLLGIATGGLLAFQQALSTTGNNISNANTPGYSREQVNLATQVPQATGAGFVGTGVVVTGITRSFNQFLADQVQTATSSNASLKTYSNLAGNVANLLGDSKAGLSPALQSFFNAVQGVANNPTDPGARQVMLSQGQTLATRFQYLNQQLGDQRQSVDGQMSDAVSQINSLASSIAALNQQIVTATGQAGGQPPNSLLDQRNELINKLSQQVSVSTVTQSDGSMNVFIGKGQALVTGSQAASLAYTAAPAAGMQPVISYAAAGASGSTTPITSNISGGNLGGMLNFRTQVLEPAQAGLDQLAASVATAFNKQHEQGMTLNGTQGGAFFSTGPTVQASAGNSSTAVPQVSYDTANISNLTTSSYTLANTGGQWTLTPTNGGSTIALTGSGTAASPLKGDGLNIVLPSGATTSDSYVIQPAAAQNIGVAITDPSNIAAAALTLTGSSGTTNTGSASLSSPTITDYSNSALTDPVTIKFSGSSSPLTYTVTDTKTNTQLATGTYTSGQTFQYNGWSTTLQGTPATGDSFTVSVDSGAVGDNTNALALAGLQSTQTMNGTTTFNGNYSQLVANVGTMTNQAQTNQQAQQALLQQAQAAQQSVSGVNLDQQAADLMKYQQAYQAAAHVVAVANTTFQTLLTAVG